MTLIGLCGRTGSGKTTVSGFFKALGAFCVDCDTVSREVTVKDSACLAELTERYGHNILTKDGTLDRKKLSDIVRADGSYETLNAITHKYILERIRSSVASSGNDFCVVDAPMLFESALDKECDYKVCVISTDVESTLRIAGRDGTDGETVASRLSHQKSNVFLRENCDYIIENNGTLDELAKRTAEVFADIKRKSE